MDNYIIELERLNYIPVIASPLLVVQSKQVNYNLISHTTIFLCQL